MNVTFKHFGAHLASSRYRSIIPAQQLAKHGVEQGRDWLVIGKHGWDWLTYTRGFNNVCFDVCDDHFDGEYGDHYKDGCIAADVVTCNSEEMARRIREKTGRKAVVIPDPYEQPERAPKIHAQPLWFGHRSNLQDLVPWIDHLPDLEVVTNMEGRTFTRWSPETLDAAFDRAGIVVIPTGKSMAKSGNRAIESIRRGLFVVAGYLPAYADLGIYIGNIADGYRWALDNQEEALKRIKASQDYIRATYSPERIGELWLKTLSA